MPSTTTTPAGTVGCGELTARDRRNLLQRLIELQALALGVGAAFVVFPCAQLLERLGFTAWRGVIPMVFIATYAISAVLGHRRYR